ncbi:universal stress protein [Halohasta salina]|uniref:universal stress protein n=1 Tax=Halohasta salina TaxID=2961621 RepID=UPI0020A50AAC|nr:universal stress protein [Halohasta salina]
MYDTVLVPTDGSDAVEQALPHALRLAADTGATIQALYVVDTRTVHAADADDREAVADDLVEAGEAAVEAVADRAAAEGLEFETEIRRGTPDKEIVAHADETDSDVIVIGTDGKTPREKLQALGSVSERVVDNAPIPVFVVKGGLKTAATQ